MAAHPNQAKPPRRTCYTHPEEIRKLLGGKNRQGKEVNLGNRRRERMRKRLEALEA